MVVSVDVSAVASADVSPVPSADESADFGSIDSSMEVFCKKNLFLGTFHSKYYYKIYL